MQENKGRWDCRLVEGTNKRNKSLDKTNAQ